MGQFAGYQATRAFQILVVELGKEQQMLTSNLVGSSWL
jgi:hypothetical protein